VSKKSIELAIVRRHDLKQPAWVGVLLEKGMI
jgi:hypothetical protein